MVEDSKKNASEIISESIGQQTGYDDDKYVN